MPGKFTHTGYKRESGTFSQHNVRLSVLKMVTWEDQSLRICRKRNIYRKQRSCEGYVFTRVYLSTGGVCLSACWDTTHPESRHTPRGGTSPWAGTPWRRHPPRRRLLLRTVRILLECTLVWDQMLNVIPPLITRSFFVWTVYYVSIICY